MIALRLERPVAEGNEVKLLVALLTLTSAVLLTPTACGKTPDAPTKSNAVAGPYVHVHVRVLDANARPADRAFPEIIAIGFQDDGKSLPLVVISDKGGGHRMVSVLNVFARYVPKTTAAVSITISVKLEYLDTATVEVTDEHGRSMPHQGFDYYEQNQRSDAVTAIRLTVPTP